MGMTKLVPEKFPAATAKQSAAKHPAGAPRATRLHHIQRCAAQPQPKKDIQCALRKIPNPKIPLRGLASGLTIPNKSQTTKSQIPKGGALRRHFELRLCAGVRMHGLGFVICDLEFGIYLGFGDWDLGFPCAGNRAVVS